MSMSLLRLLTAGKSLVGLRKSESRYQLSRQRLLPKFGSRSNPFRMMTRETSAEQPENTQQQAVISAEAKSVQPAEGLSISAQVSQEPTNFESPDAPGDCESRSVGPAEAGSPSQALMASELSALPAAPVAVRGGLAEQMARLASKLSERFLRRRHPSTQPAIPRFNKPLVQGELSLDRVKVVRNDLSDTDLEIVSSKPQLVVADAKTAVQKTKKPVGTEKAWNRPAGRLFWAGKT
jgi:hypothetical protein